MEVLLEGLDSSIKPKQQRQVESVSRTKQVPRPVPETFSAGASRVASQAQGRKAPPPIVAALASEFHGEQRGNYAGHF